MGVAVGRGPRREGRRVARGVAQHQSRCGRKGSRDRFVVEMVSGGGEEARKALKHTYLVISLLQLIFLCMFSCAFLLLFWTVTLGFFSDVITVAQSETRASRWHRHLQVGEVYI